jgi:hypothetical protein
MCFSLRLLVAAVCVLGDLAAHSVSHGSLPSSIALRRLAFAERDDAAWQDPQGGKPTYRHITSTDVSSPSSFWYTERPTLFSSSVDPGWDPFQLINTDRPDYADCATVVGNGVVQLESGFLHTRRNDDVTRVTNEQWMDTAVRVGVSDTLELRLKWKGLLVEEIRDVATGANGIERGLADTSVGFKAKVILQDNWMPLQTVVGRLSIPTGDENLSSEQSEYGFAYIYSWQIRRWWFLRGSTSFDWLRQPSFSLRRFNGVPVDPVVVDIARDEYLEFGQAVSNYLQLTQRLGMFQEWFMLSRHGSKVPLFEQYHDYGFYYYTTPNSQVDLRIGWRLGDEHDSVFYGVGFGLRF